MFTETVTNANQLQIPLLVMVMLLMLYDRVPQVLHAAQQALDFVQTRYGARVVQEVL